MQTRKPSFRRSRQETSSESSRQGTPRHKSLFTVKIKEGRPSTKQITTTTNVALAEISEQPFQAQRLFYLGKGNNSEVIRRVLAGRQGWSETTNSNDLLYLKWTQNSFGFKYHLLGKECFCFNHFEYHRELSNKERLVWNLITFCETNKMNAFTFIPVTYIVDLSLVDQDQSLHNFIKFYNRNVPDNYAGPRSTAVNLPRIRTNKYHSAQDLHKRSMGNFYCKPICPKTFLGDSGAYLWILKPTFMNRGRGVSVFSSLQEFEKLVWKCYDGQGLEDYQDKANLADMYSLNKSLVEEHPLSLSEPPPQSPGQDGVKKHQGSEDKPPLQKQELSSSSEIKDTIVERKVTVLSQNQSSVSPQAAPPVDMAVSSPAKNNPGFLRVLSFIVQKYIESPLLVQGRKFDIRIWALLTQNYEVYFFKEGYLRLSSHPYSTNDHNNPFIHLTNNSVQKHCHDFNQESGNQLSLTEMRAYVPSDTIFNQIQLRLRQIVWLSMCSARRRINSNNRKDCFEVFGYDFMIDVAYKVWLIEVNTNPAIEECSAVLKQIVPRMIDDTFKLTIDKIFCNNYTANKQIYPVKGFENNENMWELLGDFREGINERVMGRKSIFLKR